MAHSAANVTSYFNGLSVAIAGV